MSQGLSPEFVVTYRNMMVDGVKREAEITKKVILAVPDAKSDYRPDPNARTAKDLAWHIATSDVHFAESVANLKFDRPGKPPEMPATMAEIVAWYDQNLQRALSRLEKMSAEQLLTPINFVNIFNFPAVLYLSFLNNHTIHHRGELATYLRPMGSKVPSIYGGSFDEPFQMPVAETSVA
jgi:uncharacterized damage-inducible protein DinB